VNNALSSEEVFISKIETLQKENGSLFDHVQSLEEQLKTARHITGVLEQDNKTLKQVNFELQSKMRKNDQSNTNVVEINSRLR